MDVGGNMAERVELRGDISREVADVLDAASIAGGRSRMALVEEILGKWSAAKVHEATLIFRATQGNPALREPKGRSGA